MKNLRKKAKALASLLYGHQVFRDETTDGQEIFLAKSVELEGCMAHGATIEEAIDNLEDAKIEYIESLLEDGLKVPMPMPEGRSTSTAGTSKAIDDTFYEKLDLSGDPTFPEALEIVTRKEKREPRYEASVKA